MHVCMYVYSLRLSIVTRFPGSFTHSAKRHTCLGSHSAFYNKLRARYGRQSFVNRHLLPPLPFSHARSGLKKGICLIGSYRSSVYAIVSTTRCLTRHFASKHESDPRGTCRPPFNGRRLGYYVDADAVLCRSASNAYSTPCAEKSAKFKKTLCPPTRKKPDAVDAASEFQWRSSSMEIKVVRVLFPLIYFNATLPFARELIKNIFRLR